MAENPAVDGMAKMNDEPMFPALGFDAMMQLDDSAFQRICDLVYTRFGINLTEKKRALVRGRLHSLIKASGFSTYGEYVDYVEEDSDGTRLLQLVDRISTNHTYFFREANHFTFFSEEILPRLLAMRKSGEIDAIRIWSAGCSSGEEAYTLAMVIRDLLHSDVENYRIRILATDISTSVLGHAQEGVYDAQKVAGLPAQYRKYIRDNKDGTITVDESLRSMILFKRLNLMSESFPFKNQFHVIFCRNVMIYFDQETRRGLLDRFYRHMAPGAHLFIGHSETLGRDTEKFRYLRPTIYTKA